MRERDLAEINEELETVQAILTDVLALVRKQGRTQTNLARALAETAMSQEESRREFEYRLNALIDAQIGREQELREMKTEILARLDNLESRLN